MGKTENLPAPDARIHIDKMLLTVTDVRPSFQQRSKQETQREISAKLYSIFEKYGGR